MAPPPVDLLFLSRAIVSGLLESSDLHLWNSILHSLARSASPELALPLFRLLREKGLVPDSYTFTSALKAVAHLALPTRGQQLHSLSLKTGFGSDTFVHNSLIHMYSSCHSVLAARRVFDSALHPVRDVVSWNSMISGYLQANLCHEALLLFRGMVGESIITMDAVTPVSALAACARTGSLHLGRTIHALVLANGFPLNFHLASSLLTMYAQCGAVPDARKLFDAMTDRNVVCWTSMISGYTQSGRFRESIDLYREMQIAGVGPDDATMASLLSSCAQLGAVNQGKYIHAYCDINGIGADLSVKNALVDMYSKCGDVKRALQIFKGLVDPDVFSWTVMISGLAMNGNSNAALELFSQMEESGKVVPNEVTFLGVLSACSHGGLVEQGCRYFGRMVSLYKLKPRIDHYGCMVDLFGRAKLLAAAETFIKQMPVEPDVVIWRSLLFACRAQGDIKLAEYAAERIIELEPSKCGGRVLLSNIYARESRWNDVNVVRRVMVDSSIQKKPGCSFIEVNGNLHEFFATDSSHDQIDVIDGVLWEMNRFLLSEPHSLDSKGKQIPFEEGLSSL